jgi:hypothetical protein
MSWFQQKLIIDRSIWRCGRDSRFKHGNEATALLDNQGMMCCLGQACLQLGIERRKMLKRCSPQDVLKEVTYLTVEPASCSIKPVVDSRFSDEAMHVNDSEVYTRTGRELALYLVGKRHGIFIQFIGGYTD